MFDKYDVYEEVEDQIRYNVVTNREDKGRKHGGESQIEHQRRQRRHFRDSQGLSNSEERDHQASFNDRGGKTLGHKDFGCFERLSTGGSDRKGGLCQPSEGKKSDGNNLEIEETSIWVGRCIKSFLFTVQWRDSRPGV